MSRPDSLSQVGQQSSGTHIKPRILHVIDHTGSGGAQVALLNILRTLKDQFFFSVAVIGNAGYFSEEYRKTRIKVFELGKGGSRWNPMPVLALSKLIREQGIELVHAHLYKSYILGALAGWWHGCNVVFYDQTGVHPESLKYYFRNPVSRILFACSYRYALTRCDRVLLLTQYDLQNYRKWYSISPEKLTFLPNSIDVSEFDTIAEEKMGTSLRRDLGLSDETKLVVMVARLAPEKDWFTFLNVAAKLQSTSAMPCAFLVVGSGPEEYRLRHYADEHQIRPVFFLGLRRDVPEILRQCDVFMLTSCREPFGIVILEAMAARCPVVSTRSGGPESILAHDVDGLLAEVGDVQGLANHIQVLLKDRGMRDRITTAARRTVMERYNIQSTVSRLAAIYGEVLATGQRRNNG